MGVGRDDREGWKQERSGEEEQRQAKKYVQPLTAVRGQE